VDHDRLLDKAQSAIGEVFTDTSVDSQETRRSLQVLRDEIDICIAALAPNKD
jgi:hypothetical protein